MNNLSSIDSSDAVAVIGGSGFYQWPQLENRKSILVESEFASEKIAMDTGWVGGRPVFFLCRHGSGHSIPPHQINYRANIDALAREGVRHIIAINAVGGIRNTMGPGALVLPDQLIDYTWGRAQTFYDAFADDMQHIDFTYPLESPLRALVKTELLQAGTQCLDGGTYGCLQGPRLETAAEIQRLKKDGCDLVGMTMMPEAALAREKGLSYFSVCVVCNWAAGIENNVTNEALGVACEKTELSVEEMKAVLAESLTKVQQALAASMKLP